MAEARVVTLSANLKSHGGHSDRRFLHEDKVWAKISNLNLALIEAQCDDYQKNVLGSLVRLA